MARLITLVAAILSLGGLLGCAGDREKKGPAFDIAGEFAKVQGARAALEEARRALEGARAELEALAGKARLTNEEAARKQELQGQLASLEKAFETAYDDDQSALSNFLTATLNDDTLKNAPQTQQALRLYADGALANARDRMEKSGDYAKAIEILQTAESYYEFAGLEVPADLRAARERAQALRYLTKERFDQLKKGMTPEDVRAITGTPLYANVRESEVQGRKITMWLFPRDPSIGGAAALYFDKGKLYAMKWDATSK